MNLGGFYTELHVLFLGLSRMSSTSTWSTDLATAVTTSHFTQPETSTTLTHPHVTSSVAVPVQYPSAPGTPVEHSQQPSELHRTRKSSAKQAPGEDILRGL